MLMDDTHVVHHPLQESADRPGITRSRFGSPNCMSCCLVHPASEFTSEAAPKRDVSGFTAIMGWLCPAGWMDRLIVGNALSRSNVPAGVSPRGFLDGRDALASLGGPRARRGLLCVLPVWCG